MAAMDASIEGNFDKENPELEYQGIISFI